MRGIIIAILGAILSVGFTAIGAYTWLRSTYLSLPTPTLARLLSVAIPILNYLTTISYFRTSKTNPRISLDAALSFLSFLDTILITLASANLPASTLSCVLDTRWRSMFEIKDGRSVRRIQDSLDCCGLRSTVDKAWPFPDKEHGTNACMLAFGRTRSCENGWMGQQRLILGLMILIGACSFLSKVVVLLTLRYNSGLLYGRRGDRMRASPRHITEGEHQDQEGGIRYLDRPQGDGSNERASTDSEERVLVDVHDER